MYNSNSPRQSESITPASESYLAKVEEAAREAHKWVIDMGLSVSLWNVSQATVQILGVSSWRAVGCDYGDIPRLDYIQTTEAKVNAFIHCFSSARLLATIQDLNIEICKAFEVQTFEELWLGYLRLHPLVITYFNISPYAFEICWMTTEELVSQLSLYIFKNNDEVAEGKIHGFLQRFRIGEKYAGIQMKSLGTYITYLAEAKGAEHALLRSIKQNERMKLKLKTEIPSDPSDHASSSDQFQNALFNEMEMPYVGRTSQFQQFQTTDEEIRVFAGKMKSAALQCSKEEVLVLMLEQFVQERWMNSMSFLFQSNPCLGLLGLSIKALRCGFMDYLLEGTNSQKAMNSTTTFSNLWHLDDDEIEFVSIWKEICLNSPIYKVSALMLKYYGKCDGDKEHLQFFLNILPYGRCLLHVAVRVMKTIALVDRLREGVSTCDNNMNSVSPHPLGTDTGITEDEIVRKIGSYFGFDHGSVRSREFPKGKQIVIHGCEAWLRKEFFVSDFSNLGFGNFFEFLKKMKHSSLLPPQIMSFVAGAASQNHFEVSVDDKQIMVIIDQAKRSLGSQSHLDEGFISRILANQYPSISLSVISTENKIKTEDENKKQTKFTSRCSVVFSSTLVLPKGESQLTSGARRRSGGSDTAKTCLLEAPVLADLQAWSRWDHVFEPSLGPLVHWLLYEGYVDGFCCIVTRNGSVIRVDGHSSCDEDLSKVFLEGSPFKVASQILSLLWRYNGCSNAPMSLLKKYIGSALEAKINKNGETTENVSKFILNCFDYIPSEFHNFTAELFVPILCNFNKDAHEIMLSQCNGTHKRIMLREIGLYLGIVKWTDDSKALNVKVVDSGSENVVSPRTEEKANARVINCSLDEGSCADVTDEEKIQYRNRIIEDIRRKEFGIEADVSSVNSELLKKQHAREGRALGLLSTELYSHDSHFILELVQNADDNSYAEDVEPTLVFIFQSVGIVVLNNEKGFSESNVRSLCDIGRSTKKGNGSTSGYIGKKGIGFKSVFRITDAPEVHSNGFHLKFDKREYEIGSILPTAIPPYDIKYIQENLLRDLTKNEAGRTTWGTCIVLPFKPNHKSQEKDMEYVHSLFSELHPSLLLFLNRLKCINFKNTLNGKLITMRREASDDGTVLISQGNEMNNWLVVNQDLDASQVRNDVKITRISLAFSLERTINGEYEPNLYKQPVFAFLPLRKYGFNFILQADFSLTSAREEVDHDSAWNQWLLTKFPDLFVKALKSFCQLSCFKDKTGKAITVFMKFIPRIGEVYGFFSYLPDFILSKLRTSECMLLEGTVSKWVPPCKAVRGWDDEVRDFLSDALLEKYLGLGYLDKEIVLTDFLANELAVQNYGPKLLVNVIRAVCNEKDGINKLGGLNWLANWLHSFDASLGANFDENTESNLLNEVREFPIMPLSDGSYVALKEGTVWMPLQNSISRFGVQCEIERFPAICSNLRILNPLIFSHKEEGRVEKILGLLTKLGAKQLSPHDVVKNHILQFKLDEETMESKKILLIEFLTFVLYHFQMPCAQCSTEKDEIISELGEKRIILTNHGFKSPNEESIHFGVAYGNSIQFERLIGKPELIWHELDDSYLTLPDKNSQLYDRTKWKDFFNDLGVNDFLQVAELNRLISIISVNKDLDRSKYLMELLDANWDKYFSSISNEKILPEFMKTIYYSKWVASSDNENLYCPTDLFYECEAVLSILGSNAPYAIPKITNRDLVKNLGLKDTVNIEDILRAIDNWSKSETHKASIWHMSKLYNHVQHEISSSAEKSSNFTSNMHIFVPSIIPSDQTEIIPGTFHSPSELYWHEPTGCLDLIRSKKSSHTDHKSQIKTISTVYPELRDFFVNICGVLESPNFDEYFEILLELVSVSSPTESAQKVFQVLTMWAEDLSTGKANPEKLGYLKSKLTARENRVLPTVNNKWVSLHPSSGLICWSNKDELVGEISQLHNIQFLKLSEVSGKVADLLRDVGVQLLSEVLFREAIFGPERDDSVNANRVINRVLPYAQRYICKKHPGIYDLLQLSEFEKVSKLRVVSVEYIRYKNTIRTNDMSIENVSTRSCLLLGSTLYTTKEADYPSIFLEFSRLLFDGTPNEEMANFLDTLIFMYHQGIKDQQIEYYIIKNQQLPQLNQREKIWSLQIFSVPIVQDQQIIPSSSLSVPAHQLRTKPFKPNKPKMTNQVSTSSNFTPSPPQFETPYIYYMSGNIEPIQVRNVPLPIYYMPENIGPVQVRNVPMRNEINFQDSNFVSMIGKEGELAAYKYFKEMFKDDSVTWVNECEESFQPYDILVRKMNGEIEFIEVKATVSATKDWFEISVNEWNFANEKRERFSIAWVLFSREMISHVIEVFRDPVKLCGAQVPRLLQLVMHVTRNMDGIM